jgi:nicotinamide mononucleotide transporter
VSRAWEVAANALNTASIVLATMNSVHTWWTGIAGCLLFGAVFFASKLYADVVLQTFFVGASLVGWWNWVGGTTGVELPVRRCRPSVTLALAGVGAAGTLGCGWLFYRFTDAYAPFLDSAILTFSVLGQLLLVARRYESWWCWLLVNTIAVPVYASKHLYLTAALYAAFWVNAVVALVRWRRLIVG